jgi:hypothetical protein
MNLSLFQCTLFILFIVFIFDLFRENYKAYNDQAISLTDNKEITENENIYNQHNKVSFILESPYIIDLKSNTKVLEFLNGCLITSFVLVYDESSPITKQIMGDFILMSAQVGISSQLQSIRINIRAAPCFYKMGIPHVPYMFIQLQKHNKIVRIPYKGKISYQYISKFIDNYLNKQ